MSLYGSIYKNILFPLYSKHIKKNGVYDEYIAAQHRLTWRQEALRDFQWQRLQKLLTFCWREVPYYEETWRGVGITDIADIKSLHDFAKLPLLTKDDVSKNYERLIPKRARGKNIVKATGGSTGQPFQFELDHGSDAARQAIMWRGYGWLHAGLGTKSLFLWGDNIGHVGKFRSLKERLYHAFYHRKMVSTFDMNINKLGGYVDQINSYKPEAIISYVNPLYLLAKHINKHGISIYSPKSLLTGAEPLYEHQREEIEKAFKSKVFNTYGCREFMLIAAECEHQSGLHINIDHLVVETIDGEGQPITEVAGDIVITDLMNYGMPIIRYVNGDMATLTSAPCSCNNPLPLIKKINGRKLDVIKTKNGQMIPGELFPHLFKEFEGISKFQVKQSTIESLDIFIVTNDAFQEDDLTSISNEINRYSKRELVLNYHRVDDIPLTSSGKYRVTVSELY